MYALHMCQVSVRQVAETATWLPDTLGKVSGYEGASASWRFG